MDNGEVDGTTGVLTDAMTCTCAHDSEPSQTRRWPGSDQLVNFSAKQNENTDYGTYTRCSVLSRFQVILTHSDTTLAERACVSFLAPRVQDEEKTPCYRTYVGARKHKPRPGRDGYDEHVGQCGGSLGQVEDLLRGRHFH